jgi:hypothetical protein
MPPTNMNCKKAQEPQLLRFLFFVILQQLVIGVKQEGHVYFFQKFEICRCNPALFHTQQNGELHITIPSQNFETRPLTAILASCLDQLGENIAFDSCQGIFLPLKSAFR